MLRCWLQQHFVQLLVVCPAGQGLPAGHPILCALLGAGHTGRCNMSLASVEQKSLMNSNDLASLFASCVFCLACRLSCFPLYRSRFACRAAFPQRNLAVSTALQMSSKHDPPLPFGAALAFSASDRVP